MTKSKRVAIRMTEREAKQLNALAKRAERSVADYIRMLIKREHAEARSARRRNEEQDWYPRLQGW